MAQIVEVRDDGWRILKDHTRAGTVRISVDWRGSTTATVEVDVTHDAVIIMPSQNSRRWIPLWCWSVVNGCVKGAITD